jgi:hypothetical protein
MGAAAEGERFDATEATRGPWSPLHQHGGPPAALLARAIERVAGIEDAFVGRVTVELLGPVPIAPVVVAAEVVRGGRSVELVEATLSGDDGRALMRARSWRLRRQAIDVPADLPGTGDPPPPPPSQGGDPQFPAFLEGIVGWSSALEFLAVAGGYTVPGPATVWMRMRIPLLPGEAPSPLQRTLIAADAGNGMSAVLDWDHWQFINTDLTVHLHREAAGEWVALESTTYPEPDGVGIADSRIYDERGPIGRGVQTLLIAPKNA